MNDQKDFLETVYKFPSKKKWVSSPFMLNKLTFIMGPGKPLCPGNFSGLMTAGLDGGIADAGLI